MNVDGEEEILNYQIVPCNGVKLCSQSSDGCNFVSAVKEMIQCPDHCLFRVLRGCSFPYVSDQLLESAIIGHFYSDECHSFELRVINVKQQGRDDCGLFAVTFAVDLCFGKDLFTTTRK